MMRLLLACLLLASSAAYADTFIGLNNPNTVQRWACAGESFTDDQHVAGVCQLTVPSTVKYAQPARYQYVASWDAATGAVTLGALVCYSPAHLGIDHSGCPQMVTLLDTNEVVVLEGVSFWYVTSNSVGAELLHTQTGSLVYWP